MFVGGSKLCEAQVVGASDYNRWSARDWVRHYAGPRFDPRRSWDPFGRPLPKYASGQMADEPDPAEREFPLGFYDPAVPPVQAKTTLVTTVITVSFGLPTNNAEVMSVLNPALGSLAVTSQDILGNLFITTTDVGSDVSLQVQLGPGYEEGEPACVDLFSGGAVVFGGPGVPAQVATDIGDTWIGCIQNSYMVVTIVTPNPVTGVTSAGVAVVSRPQFRHGFRGERLVIPSDIAVNFSLLDVKIGNRSQLLNSVALPAVTFVEGGVGMRLLLDEVPVAMDVALVVANLAGETLPFRGTLIGRTPASNEEDEDEDGEGEAEPT